MLPLNYQWNLKRKKARRDIQRISIYTKQKHTWYKCMYRVKQHLIVLKFIDNVSINKVLVTKFVTVKVSQNLNLIWNMSTQWNQQLIGTCFQNKTFVNKLIARDHRIPHKWTEYKIFKLKCRNIKLPNVLKYN